MKLLTEHKLLLHRLFLYGVAGALVVVVNPALFWVFHERLHWNNYLSYACSLATLNVLQFLWNYHVGFRTGKHWTAAFRRQLVILCLANLANYLLVVGLQALLPDWKKTVIVAVQLTIGVCKFVAYHFWVYPAERARSGA